MLVSLVFNCTHNVLEAGNIYLVIEYALQIIIVDLLRQVCLNFWLVCFTVQGLRHCRLVRFIGQFGFNFYELSIHFLLEA